MANQVEISIIAIDSASNILQRIAGRFGTLGAVAAAAIGMASQAAGQAITNTMAWADSLDNVQDKLGGTNAEVAAYAYAAKVAGISVDTFVRGNVILEKGLTTAAGKLDTTGKALEKWGVNVKDVNGKVKDQATLTTDIAKKYGELATAQERVNFLTEIYGRQGAELIDFFDVLNGEGGVGTLAQKMTALGLAIDPARYEAFNRNLEKLKMIGLSLQVAFTEKLMPVFEGMLNWASAFATADPAGRLSMIQDALSKINLSDWAKSVDWKKFSADIVSGINSVDWEAVGKAFSDGLANLGDAITTVFGGIDWTSIGTSSADAFTEAFAGAMGAESPTWQSIWDKMNENMTANNAQAQANAEAGWAQVGAFLEQVKTTMISAAIEAVNSTVTQFGLLAGLVAAKVGEMVSRAGATAAGLGAALGGGVSSSIGYVLSKISELVEAMHAQIHVIVQVFQQIGYMAMRMLGSSIQGQVGTIINIIQKVIDTIQASITDITIGIDFSMPGMPNFNSLLGRNSLGAPLPKSKGAAKRASGEGFASGTEGWRSVPAGYPNDSFMIGLTSGEHFAVTPKGEGMGGGMTVVFNYQPTISLATKQEAEEAIVPFVRSAMRQLKGQAV